MSGRNRRLLARRRREHEQLVRRGRAADEFDAAAAVEEALAPRGPQVESARSVALDQQRARAIPIIGPMSGGGAIPGSRPSVTSKLGRWSGR